MGFRSDESRRPATMTDAYSPGSSSPVPYPDNCPPSGRYRHYRGGEYEVMDVARHSETEEWLVVYRPLYGDSGLWVRPLAMFIETVAVDDGEGGRREVPRFEFLGPDVKG